MNAFTSAAMLFAIDPNQVSLYLGSLCEKHGEVAARVITSMAQKNGWKTEDLLAKLSSAYGLSPVPGVS